MISALLFIDNKTYGRALQEARSSSKSKSAISGKIGEAITKGVFKSSKEATTASGKADILDVKVSTVANILSSLVQ